MSELEDNAVSIAPMGNSTLVIAPPGVLLDEIGDLIASQGLTQSTVTTVEGGGQVLLIPLAQLPGAESWVGTGDNTSLTAKQVTEAVGADNLAALASTLKVPVDDVAADLASGLPAAIDDATPDGHLATTATPSLRILDRKLETLVVALLTPIEEYFAKELR